jgi:hypothetical protein
MILHAARPPRRIAALGVLLALSLLFTQWLGYAHAIAHAGSLPEVESAVQIQSDSFDHAKASSACAALDALTLGAGLQSAALPPLPAMAADAPVMLPLRAGWHRLFTAHFSSRAPPLNA